jgi:hypothetical protein
MTRQLLITYVSLSTLMPDPKNPRVHTPRQVRQISRSLQTFGFIVPIKSVTYVFGINRNPCVRNGPRTDRTCLHQNSLLTGNFAILERLGSIA